MTYKEFVKATICNLRQPTLDELKQLLIDEYINFIFIDREDVTGDILAEKVCDYFAILEIKSEKSFDKYLEAYLKGLDAIVRPHIVKGPQNKKADTSSAIIPRARRYYEKVVSIKKKKSASMSEIIDYSRIMMCLYASEIKNKGKLIENFDYAAECLVPEEIIEAMKNEEVSAVRPLPGRKRFDMKELYSEDVCMLILSILILCSIIDGKVEREPDHE